MTNILSVQAAHWTSPGSSVRKQSVSDKCFICASATNVFCAKAKRQQQCFICAKAKRQQQCFICAKAKRQQQSAQSERKSTTRYGNGPLIRQNEKLLHNFI